VSKSLKLDGLGNTKTNRNRVVMITDELRLFLVGLPDGPLFMDRDGKHWTPSKFRNWRIRNWQPAAVKAGIGTITEQDGKRRYKGARPYDLRHFAASSMLYQGIDPVRVAQAMGHSPAVLYSTYAHVIAESQAA
jgi:integrase